MKTTIKYLALWLYLTLFLCVSHGNTTSEGFVMTPNGSAVPVAVDRTPELSLQEMIEIENSIRRDYPNATILSNATRKYNCHSFAWYYQNTANNAWMNDPSPYWLDGSYVFVTRYLLNSNSVLPDIPAGVKINYPPRYDGTIMTYPYTIPPQHLQGDHSAISDGNGWVVSKWGQSCLVKHKINYCGYGWNGTYVLDTFVIPIPTYSLSGTVHSGSATGPVISGATVSIAGKTATTNTNGSFSINSITSGVYTLTISATGYTTYTNSSYAVNANQSGLNFSLIPNLPNLIPFIPSGWSYPIVVSKISGSTTDSSPLYTTDTLYVNWAVLNDSSTSITSNFNDTLYVDGSAVNTWTIASLAAGYYTSATGYSIGSLSTGTHTIKIVADSSNVVTESNGSDNTYTKTITVLSPGYSLNGTVHSGSAAGPAISGAIVSIAGKSATTDTSGAFNISGISSGTYTLTISATGYTTYTNSSYAINANQSGLNFALTPILSNLIPHKPSGWSDKIVVSTTPGSTTDSSPLYSTDTLYVNRAVLNDSNVSITTSFNTTLYIDGTARYTWTSASLAAGYYNYLTSGYSIGTLNAGTHTIKIVADSSNSITESNESDNTYTKTVSVLAAGYTLSGTVHSGSVSGPAVSGATVSIAGKTASTDTNGAFSINGIPAGTYTLTISASGFTTYTNPSYVLNSNQSSLNFALTYNVSSNIRILGSSQPYSLLQTAYNDAVNGAVIQAQGIIFFESPIMNTSTAVTIRGGYDPTFTTQSGYTTLQGVLTVGQGSLVIDRLIIK